MKPIVSENFSTCSATSRSRPNLARALFGGDAQLRQATDGSLGREADLFGGLLHLRTRVACLGARGGHLAGVLSELVRVAGQRDHEARGLGRALAGSARGGRYLLARSVDLLCRSGQGLDVGTGAIRRPDHRLNRALDREHQRELWRQQRQHVTIGIAVHARIGVSDAPKAHQLSGVIQRDQHLRAGCFPPGHDHLLGGERTGDDRPPQPHGLAGESGIGVEAKLAGAAVARGRVGDELHFVRPRVVPREAHVFPRDQPAGELLDSWEALRQADVPRDRLRQALNEAELIGSYASPNHRYARDRGARDCGADHEECARLEPRVREREARERQARRASVHDGFPSRGECGVDPGEATPEGELDVEGAVHHAGQHDEEHGQRHQVARGQRLGTRAPTEAGIGEARNRRAHREVRGVVERCRHGQTAQREVACDHRQRREQDAEGPATVEDGVCGDAEDERGESIARKRDAVATGQRPDHDEHHDFLRDVGAERRPSGREGRQPSGDRRQGTERDECPHQQARRRFEAGEGTHGQARSKVGPLA